MIDSRPSSDPLHPARPFRDLESIYGKQTFHVSTPWSFRSLAVNLFPSHPCRFFADPSSGVFCHRNVPFLGSWRRGIRCFFLLWKVGFFLKFSLPSFSVIPFRPGRALLGDGLADVVSLFAKPAPRSPHGQMRKDEGSVLSPGRVGHALLAAGSALLKMCPDSPPHGGVGIVVCLDLFLSLRWPTGDVGSFFAFFFFFFLAALGRLQLLKLSFRDGSFRLRNTVSSTVHVWPCCNGPFFSFPPFRASSSTPFFFLDSV